VRYCNKCKVIIENSLDSCPLCNQRTLKRNETAEIDFPVQTIYGEDLFKKIMRFLVFIFITLIGTNIVLNLTFSFKTIWAPYFIIVLFYAYLILRAAMRSFRDIGTIVMINVWMLSIIGFIIDLVLGFNGWSLDYVIPFLILAGIIALVIFMLIKPTHFLAYFIYLLMIATFGLALLILLWAGFVVEKVPSIITAFVSFLAIVGMFIFGDRSAKNEFVKRFHF
jgi:hypothetical protein